MRYGGFYRYIFVSFILYFLLGGVAVCQEYSEEDAPGALSPSHTESVGLINCLKCHNEDFEVPAQLCLACHQEIAIRISKGQGYHQDKVEECALCHTEHAGAETILVNLDPSDFDHEETGYSLTGIHGTIKDCHRCHRLENTIPRTISRSFLFTGTGCQICHPSPHPGKQDLCLSCHTPESWRVVNWKRH